MTVTSKYDDGIDLPAKLASQVEAALSAWRTLLDKTGDAGLLDLAMAPAQETVRGEAGSWATGASGTPSETLDKCYESRDRLEAAVKTLDRRFFHDPDYVAARLSYAPVRAIGWWCKNLQDEIDWLEHDGVVRTQADDPGSANPTGRKTRPLPPSFTDYELTDAGVARVCKDILTLQGRQASDLVDLESMIRDEVQAREAKLAEPSDHEQREILRAVLTEAYVSRPCVGDVVGIDLETTGLHAIRDWCVNAGWAWMDLHDETEKLHGESARSYGVSSTRMELGNPTEAISGIKTTDLVGLLPLEADDAAQGQLLDLLQSAPFVAHNAFFEDSWFRQCVDGYAEAKRDGLVKIIDSRKISQRLDPYKGKTDNKLQSYARRWGALEADENERHLGLQDAEIMLVSLHRHLHSLGVA